MEAIKFYKVGDPFGEFSNFSKHPIFLDGVLWPTSEHYFQAQKFDDMAARETIRKTAKAIEAAKLGRSNISRLVKNWDHLRNEVMYKAVKAKFTQYESLTVLLLSTADSEIIEHTTNDNYWGDGGDGTGKNVLGQILIFGIKCQ